MEPRKLTRWLCLPTHYRFVPVAKLESLLWKVCECDTDSFAHGDWGFEKSSDYFVTIVRRWRDSSRLSVFATGGYGPILHDNIISGVLRREDFIKIADEEFHIEVVDCSDEVAHGGTYSTPLVESLREVAGIEQQNSVRESEAVIRSLASLSVPTVGGGATQLDEDAPVTPASSQTGTGPAPSSTTSIKEPKGDAAAGDMVPVQRSRAQEQAILLKIKEMGLDAEALPRNDTGRTGIKAKIKESLKGHNLFHGTKIFDKAWQRLRDFKQIRDRR
jgi:hypothetical protein